MSKTLSASRLNDFLGCPHQSALWLAGVAPDDAADETLNLIREKGYAHEASVFEALKREHGEGVQVPGTERYEVREAATLAAIGAQVPLIFQGALYAPPWIGLPDFLVRKTRGGEPVYEPEDAKLARKAKAQYILQLGLYAELLEQRVGPPVGNGVIHGATGIPETFDLRQTRFILRRMMRGFEAFVGEGERKTRPVPCVACAQCDYKARCEAEWRDADSPFFVAGLSAAQVLKLEDAGVRTLAELAALGERAKIEGIGTDTLAKLRAQARLQLQSRTTGEHEVELLPSEPGRGFYLLPAPDDGDLFFDMEGDPLADGGLEYLFGIVGPLGPGGEIIFHPLWAHTRAEEKASFEALMRLFTEHFERHPNAHVYHYAQYEPNALKRLAMRHATMEAELDQMLRDRRFVDLYRVVRQSLRASTEGYSLKDLERIYWGERTGEVTTAGASIVEYERWCTTGEAGILEAIAQYNQVDCESTSRMRDWLESKRPVSASYSVGNGEPDERPEASEERDEREARKRALAVRVRASATADQRVREVIAELLWFHQRAQKPGWWAVFERQSWSDEELVEDAESLGGLVIDADRSPVRDKRSMITFYRCPPQDTKLKVGSTPKIAATRANAGEIVELDAEEGLVALRRGVGSGPMPERLGLIPAPLNQVGLPEAVEAFAVRFADGRLTGDAALLDFLQRRNPRIKGRAAGASTIDPAKPLLEAAIEATLNLDQSCLFLQGPPGTGKTYTIARVIVALLKAGHRVGVSSNSHRAIHEVLSKLEEYSGEIGFSFRGAKKGSRADAETAFDSAHIHTVWKSEEVAPGDRLVGGTAFHFCRDDQQGAFDYLIVDEAGQVALGNLVAMAGAAKNLVLVGDQMQLPQPVQGVHPGETGLSCLDYFLEGKATVPPEQGILLNESRRLHPDLCSFISAAIYDGRLAAHPDTAKRHLVLRSDAHPVLRPAGLSLVGVRHQGCTQSSPDEVKLIAALIESLMMQKVQRLDGTVTQFKLDDVLVVAPYNMQVNLLKQRLRSGIAVGTVDKFQGQEATVAILSMATSRGEDAPRGTEFLFNRNRFNVAVSRAQCLAIVVHGVDLLDGSWDRIEDLQRLNLFAHAEAVGFNSVS